MFYLFALFYMLFLHGVCLVLWSSLMLGMSYRSDSFISALLEVASSLNLYRGGKHVFKFACDVYTMRNA